MQMRRSRVAGPNGTGVIDDIRTRCVRVCVIYLYLDIDICREMPYLRYLFTST